MSRSPASFMLVALCVLAGCRTASFEWRAQRYELPEEALDAQRRDLEQEGGGVAPVLEEERLGGAALVALPTLKGLKQALRPGAVDDEEGKLFFAMGLVRGELRALARSLERAGLFESVEVVEVELPGTEPAPPGARWRVVATPHPGYQRVEWSIEAVGGGQAGVDAPSPSDGAGRFDAFVQATSAAGRRARGGEASASRVPTGWAPFVLPPEGGAERCQVAVPVVPEAQLLRDDERQRSWLMTCTTRDLALVLVYDLFRPPYELEPGLESAMRDRLRDELPAQVVEEDDPGGAEKWVVLALKDGRAGVARIRQAGRGLAAALVAAPARDLLRAADGPIRERLTDAARAYLDSLELSTP